MQSQRISSEQFTILKTLARVGIRSNGECASEVAARLYFVDGETMTAAAATANISQPSCRKVVHKMREALASVRAFNTLAA